jgi:hypothetical protein
MGYLYGEIVDLLSTLNKTLFKNVYCADKQEDYVVYHMVDTTQIYEMYAGNGRLTLTSAPKLYNRFGSVRTIYEGKLSAESVQDAVGLLHDNLAGGWV